MADPRATRQDTWRLVLKVNGESYGVWENKSGGGIDSDAFKHKPGAMAKEISLGGTQTRGNVTLTKLHTEVEHSRINALYAAVGKGLAEVQQQPLDPDGNAWGDPIVFVGQLKRVQEPSVDASSTSGAMLEVEVTVDGVT